MTKIDDVYCDVRYTRTCLQGPRRRQCLVPPLQTMPRCTHHHHQSFITNLSVAVLFLLLTFIFVLRTFDAIQKIFLLVSNLWPCVSGKFPAITTVKRLYFVHCDEVVIVKEKLIDNVWYFYFSRFSFRTLFFFSTLRIFFWARRVWYKSSIVEFIIGKEARPGQKTE